MLVEHSFCTLFVYLSMENQIKIFCVFGHNQCKQQINSEWKDLLWQAELSYEPAADVKTMSFELIRWSVTWQYRTEHWVETLSEISLKSRLQSTKILFSRDQQSQRVWIESIIEYRSENSLLTQSMTKTGSDWVKSEVTKANCASDDIRFSLQTFRELRCNFSM